VEARVYVGEMTLIPVILPTYSAYKDGTDRVFRNVGIQNSNARESPRRKDTTFRKWRKFEKKNLSDTLPTENDRRQETLYCHCSVALQWNIPLGMPKKTRKTSN
jgi:hypothetical protein